MVSVKINKQFLLMTLTTKKNRFQIIFLNFLLLAKLVLVKVVCYIISLKVNVSK